MADKYDLFEAIEDLLADCVNRLERLDDLIAELKSEVVQSDME
jgi:hypothetical protein